VRKVWFLAATVIVGSVSLEATAEVSITNRDDKRHKVTVVEGDSKKDHSLDAGATLDAICGKGCIVRLNDSDNDEYELEGNEVVSIEDGYLYYDGPDAPAAPSSGEPGKQGAPKQ
jgi:translation initiation factor 1 (eIF-1/SUI1)